ncbi:MAG: single-stranded DNA-binding protein [Candidatus Nanopelagicales bacterium]
MDQGSTVLIGTVVSNVYEHRAERSHRVARFRMVVAPRRFDRSSGSWIDREASYFTVVLARALAANVLSCLRRGDPVVVVGQIRVHEWERDGRRGSTTEIHANSVGHDLTRGIARFSRPAREAGQRDAAHGDRRAGVGAAGTSVAAGIT